MRLDKGKLFFAEGAAAAAFGQGGNGGGADGWGFAAPQQAAQQGGSLLPFVPSVGLQAAEYQGGGGADAG